MLSTLSGKWGPTVTNKDYELLIEGDTFYAPFIALDGHSLGSPDVDMADPVSVTSTVRERGRLIQRMEYIKPGLIRSRSYEIGFPEGAIWTPLMKITENYSKSCRRNVFTRYLCEETPCFAHAFRYQNAIFDPVQEAETVIATNDDEAGLTHTTNMHTSRRQVYYHLRASEQYDAAGEATVPVYVDAAFVFDKCETCQITEGGRHSFGYVVGNDGDTPAVGLIKYMPDRFTNTNTTTVAAPAGAITAVNVKAVYAEGDFAIFVAMTATDSQIWYTHDRGTNMSIATKSTGAVATYSTQTINKIVQGLGYYWLLGENGFVARSQDGHIWTTITLPTALATFDIKAGAADEATRSLYLVGIGTTNAIVVRSDGTLFADISTTVLGTLAQTMNTVRVLAPDHIAIAGTAGYYYETTLATVDPNWQRIGVGVAHSIKAVAGDSYRTVVVTSSGSNTGKILERSVLTDMRFSDLETVPGSTFSRDFVTAVTGETDMGANDFLVITDREIGIIKSCLPDA